MNTSNYTQLSGFVERRFTSNANFWIIKDFIKDHYDPQYCYETETCVYG